MHIWWRICSPSEWEGEIFRSDFNRHGGFFDEAKSPCKARALNTGADWRGAGRRRYKYCMGRAWREMLMKRMWTGSPALFPPPWRSPLQHPPTNTTTTKRRLATLPPLQRFSCPFLGSRWQCCAVSSHLVSTLLPPCPPSFSSSSYLASPVMRPHICISLFTLVTSGQPLHPLLLLLWCVVPLSHLPSMLCCIFHPLWAFFYLTKATVQV